ncbi:uncharacterized protein LOC135834701 [Planococcus citri]|uniref:uncharacterized protein LOC135834701 n=1 Tax=Planococcus citri TaxID=170843 RepID=UPI0031F7851B
MSSSSQFLRPIHLKYVIFIFIITIISSHGQNQSNIKSSICKSVLLKNCTGDACIANISVVDKCPSNFTRDDIKRKCENFMDSDLLNDTFLFIPVTSRQKSITYWNIYCALCNQQGLQSDNFTFWTLRALHKPIENHNKLESFESNIDLAVLEKIEVDHDTQNLISKFHGFTRMVILLRYLPSELTNSSYQSCSTSITSNDDIELIAKNITGGFAPTPENFNCTGTKFCSRRKIPQPDTCVYFDPNDVPCVTNKFYVQGVDFTYDKNQVIRTDGEILDINEYSYPKNDSSSDVIFFCKRKNIKTPVSKELIQFTKYMKYISTFLLLVFLVMKTNKENFRSLPNLILYSYCIASLWVYLYHIFSEKIADKLILRTYLLFYVHLSHAFWAALISYEYWYVISAALKFKKPKHLIKRYKYYAFVGWILPALLLGSVYPFLTEEDKTSSCPLIPHHRNVNVAQNLSQWAHYLLGAFYILYLAVYFVLIPVVAIQGCFFIRLARHNRSLEERSDGRHRNKKTSSNNTELDYLFIFTKIAYLMGIHWMLMCVGMILTYFFDFGFSLGNVFSVLFAFHGTFIALAFAFTRTERKRYKRSYRSFMSRSSRSTQVESLTAEEGLNKMGERE